MNNLTWIFIVIIVLLVYALSGDPKNKQISSGTDGGSGLNWEKETKEAEAGLIIKVEPIIKQKTTGCND